MKVKIMDERDYYAEVRDILEDWISEAGIDRAELRDELEDVLDNLVWEEE